MNPVILGTTYSGGISGDGYGAGIYRDGQTFLVTLSIHGHVERQRVYTYNDASDLTVAFCHACRMWNVVQAREKAMAQGYAVLG